MSEERLLSWNEFQKANKGKSVTVAEWKKHRLDVKRAARERQPDPPSSAELTVDSVGDNLNARAERKAAAASQWKELLSGKKERSDSLPNDSASSSDEQVVKRGRPPSGRGSQGGSHRKNKRSADGRPLSKAARSVGESTSYSRTGEMRSTSTAPRPEPPTKKDRVDWSTETERVTLSMNSCKEGLPIREASRMFGVPYSVLQRRMAKEVTPSAGLGSKPAISEVAEKKLHDHVLKLADLGFGIDWCDIRILAVKIAASLGIADFSAGGGWTDGFKRRFADLARLRTAALERNRMGALNPELIGSFFDLLGKSIKRVEELSGEKLTPDRILNVDEIGFTLNMTAGYLIGRRSSRHAHAATGNSRDHVSAATTIRADGTYLPHFFLLAGKRSKAEYLEDDGRLKGTPPGSTFALTEKGYMTDAAYSDYADHLIHHVQATRKDPSLWTLLICDGYNSHAMLPDVLAKFWGAHIYVLSFPSHTSSELQPLDITCFRPVKSHFRRAIHLARLEQGLVSVSKWQVPAIASDAFEKALTPSNVTAGFVKAGIHPFNADWVKGHSHVFDVSETLVQPSGDEALAALRLKKFEDMVASTPVVGEASVKYLDLSLSKGQEQLLEPKGDDNRDKPQQDNVVQDINAMLVLPKLVEKKKLQKRRENVIGESFSAPKQLNEPVRVELLREHSKRKADELLAQQAQKKARHEAEEPVAKVLKSLGYISSDKVTVAAMKSFLRRNSAVVQMPKSSTHPKKEEILAFLRITFSDTTLQWARAE